MVTSWIAVIAAAEALPDLFARYNPAVWPGHVIAYGLGTGVIALLAWRPGTFTNRVTATVLAGAWLWLGVVFFGMFATRSAPLLAEIYVGLFIVQALLVVRAAVAGRLVFTAGQGVSGILGWVIVAFALVVYPVLGLALGHGYPEAPLFGMAPCPTTIATFGFLLLARAPLPRHLLAIPLVWAVMGPLAAVPQGMSEDIGLVVAGVVAATVVIIRDRRAVSMRASATA